MLIRFGGGWRLGSGFGVNKVWGLGGWGLAFKG